MNKYLLMYLALCASAASGFEIKGVTVGKPTTFDTLRQAGFYCSEKLFQNRSADTPAYSCTTGNSGGSAFTIAGIETRAEVTIDPESMVVDSFGFAFLKEDGELLINALLTKYGKPQKDVRSVVRTRRGQALNQREMTWMSSSAVAVLTIIQTESAGIFNVLSRATIARDMKVEKSRKEKAAKDL